MEPRTKLQKKVVALSALLPVISPQEKALAFEKCFIKQAVRVRKRIYCLECGHTWIDAWTLASSLLGCDCPVCGNHLKMMDGYQPFIRKHLYYASLTHKNDMQVVRMFFATVIYHKHRKSELFSKEVMQHWINDTGKITTMARKTMGLSMYYDQWTDDETLVIKGESNRFWSCFNLNPDYILPNRKVLPLFKRNGYKGNFHGFRPHVFLGLILENNQAETLLKTNQISLLKYIDSHKSAISKYWPSIRICIRNGYIVKDASMWFDYIQMLKYFDKDLTCSKYVCPVDLKQSHDILLARKVKAQAKIKRNELLEKISAAQVIYAKQKKKFFGLQFIKGSISIRPFESVIQFYDEGEYLHHCVYHSGYYNKKNSLVLSARIDNVPMETVEVTLKPLAVIQSRGLQNSPTVYHNEILNLLQENIHKIAKCF